MKHGINRFKNKTYRILMILVSSNSIKKIFYNINSMWLLITNVLMYVIQCNKDLIVTGT